MPPLTLRPVARAEIAEACDWYEERRSGWQGSSWPRSGDSRLGGESPLLYPVIRKDVRRALLHRFLCSILYVADPEATVVLACFHASRDPRRWHGRR